MKRLYLLFFVAILLITTATYAQYTPETLIFQSGFEKDVIGIPSGAHRDIRGKDLNFTEKNDWVTDLEEHPNIGDFQIQYKGSPSSESYAKIIDDPTRSSNRILHFFLRTANEKTGFFKRKARIQANIYNNKNIHELWQSVDLFIHPDFNILKNYPHGIHWLTLFEFWNDSNWEKGKSKYPFRISINIVKNKNSGQELYFSVHGQIEENGKWRSIWSETNRDIPVPLGSWIETKIYFKEGKRKQGRFKFVFFDDQGLRRKVFDIKNTTVHPDNPSLDGLDHFNPMKLYTSSKVINYVRRRDKALQIYWDNLSIGIN